jgi:long-chain acyl-CoA synthetase
MVRRKSLAVHHGVGLLAPGAVSQSVSGMYAAHPILMSARSFVPRPAEGLNYPNVTQMFLARVRKTPELTALRFKRDGLWRPLSWRGWELAGRELAAGMIARFGVEPGDRIAIMARTRVEWALCDLAIALCGAVSVPIYPTSTGAEIAFLLGDSGARVLIAEHPEMLRRWRVGEGREANQPLEREASAHGGRRPSTGGFQGREANPIGDWADTPTPKVEHQVCIDVESSKHGGVVDDAPAHLTLDALREAGRATLAGVNDVQPRIEAAIAERGLEDPFTIAYTSGTTGRPKGAVLTHRNLVYEAWAIKNSIAVDRTDQHLLMLPLAHIFARHLLWAAVESGAVTAFAERMGTAARELLEVAPTYVGAVPRFYEKIERELQAEFAARSFAERKLIALAFDVGRRVSICRQRGLAIPPVLAAEHRVADKAVFARIRARFGGKLRFFVSGAAPLRRETAEFFHSIGILILEGYGLSETTGATHVNRPDRFRFGTVGPALPGCEVRVAAGGEILLRGHNVMAGYHGQRAETRIDVDGWLHTGDVGELDDGFLRITDRLQDLIITAGGKNIAPQKLEARLRAREGVAHVFVTGDRRPYLVALIGLDEPEMLALARREGLGCRAYADMARHPRIRQLVGSYVDDLNRTLPSYETIKRFAIPPEPFTSDEVTPTLRLKRKAVESRYATLIDGLYAGG